MVEKTPVVFAEVFPLKADVLPSLLAYRLTTRADADADYLGRRLGDRLGRLFPGHWVWTQHAIVTGHHEPKSAINDAVRAIKRQEKDTFKDLKSITLLRGWKPDAGAQADYAADGLFTDLLPDLEPVLASMKYVMDGKATVTRECTARGWVVDGAPALSLSIDSYLLFRQDLSSYAVKVNDPRELIGLHVADKVPSANGTVYRGEIVDVVGRLDADVGRGDLLAIAKKEGSKALIQDAAAGEWVVRVGYNEYDYVAGALDIVLYPEDYRRFGIQAQNAQQATWITPVQRARLIKKVADIAKARGLIGDAYSSENSKLFFGAKHFHYDPLLRWGRGHSAEYDGDHLFDTLKQAGVYAPGEWGSEAEPLRLGIIKPATTQLEPFQVRLEATLKQAGITLDTVDAVNLPGVSSAELERAVELAKANRPHAVIGILPGVDSRDEDDWTAYGAFKALTLDQIPTLTVDSRLSARTVDRVVDSAVLRLISLSGATPYMLATPLDYADIVAGFGSAARRGADGKVTYSILWGGDGRYLGCRVAEMHEDEEAGTISEAALETVFSTADFGGRRAVIHRNGAFRGDEKALLCAHAERIRAEFHLVEVMTARVPRLYLQAGRGIEAPGLGTTFMLNETEAFLVSSQTATATPSPLHIRTEAPFTIGKALHSVFTLTLTHHGLLRRPKLPASLHYADTIGYLALQGVIPRDGQSRVMYWL